MSQFRYDVLHPDEDRRGTGARDYDAENARINDLDWSYDQRREAIEEIIARSKLEGAAATAISGKSDTYLKARVELGRNSNATDRGAAPASVSAVRADSDADAYARSVANLNRWRDEPGAKGAPLASPAQSAEPTARPAMRRPMPASGEAAAEQEAYARSVANLNAGRDRA